MPDYIQNKIKTLNMLQQFSNREGSRLKGERRQNIYAIGTIKFRMKNV